MTYPDDFVNKIICGDCLEVVKQINLKNCIFVSDPPFNIGKDYGVYKDEKLEDEY